MPQGVGGNLCTLCGGLGAPQLGVQTSQGRGICAPGGGPGHPSIGGNVCPVGEDHVSWRGCVPWRAVMWGLKLESSCTW